MQHRRQDRNRHPHRRIPQPRELSAFRQPAGPRNKKAPRLQCRHRPPASRAAQRAQWIIRWPRPGSPPPAQSPRARSPPPPSPPRLFVYVDTIARHGSIRKEADALNIASSALNRRILDLKDELGTTLFERLPRGVRLTSAGELFVDYVRRTITELDAVDSHIEHLRGLVRGEVRIAAAESLAGDFLPRAIAKFNAEHPGVHFHIAVSGPEDMLAALARDEADLIIGHDLPRHPSVSILRSVPHPFCAVVARDHPLARRRSLKLRDCLAYPFAMADRSLAGRALIERALANASFCFEPALESNSIDAMKTYTRLSQAVCFQFRTGAMRDI
ncbi:MAG: LysR substrate-binding domain-containing protein [Candidatus Protistobacter heckmanni]|nr:LysR substrate-binding domain-containing protein [Candidatus Protistobacter heckmanni]